jgi:hypothetical protein
MPTVPLYNDRQVRTQALQPVFQNTPDVSSGARALAQGLGQVADVADRIDLRAAESKANEVDTQLTRAWDQWEDDNRGKYTNQAADGYTKAVDAWWKDAAKTYGGSLDARAQAMVGKTLSRRQTLALEQAGKHEFTEKERYADSTTEAAANTATVNALKTGDYAGEAQRIRELTDEQGRRKNWDKDQRDAARNARLGQFNTAVIAQLAEKDAAAAQVYLNGAIERGEIKPDQQPRLEAIVKSEADNQFATQKAAELATLSLKEQLAEAAKITDPQRREKTITQIKLNTALVREAEAEAERQASDQAWQMFSRGQKIPETILSSMNGRERAQLAESQRTRADRLAAGTPVKTNMLAYIDVREKLARGETVDLRAYTEKIGKAEMEQLLDIQGAVRTGGVKQDSMLTDEGRINAAIVSLGIDKRKKPEQAAMITNEIDRRVRSASAAKGGKDLTADEKQGIVDRVVLDKVFVSEFGRDPQKPLILLTPEEQKNAYVEVNGEEVKLSSIPLNDRQQIIASLQRRGEPVSEQAIAEVYVRVKKPAAAPVAAPVAAPAAAPQTRAPAPGAALRPPSIYASAEEWAAYRAAQAQKAAKQ